VAYCLIVEEGKQKEVEMVIASCYSQYYHGVIYKYIAIVDEIITVRILYIVPWTKIRNPTKIPLLLEC
jgi:hypothetical protein